MSDARSLCRLPLAAALVLCGITLAAPTRAEVVWTTWTAGVTGTVNGSATGTMGDVGVAYAGELLFAPAEIANAPNGTLNYPVLSAGQGGYWGPFNNFEPATPYLSPSVPNAPPGGFHVTAQGGRESGLHRIVFSRPVTDPLIAIYSLGNNLTGQSVTLSFDRPFTLLSAGAGFWNVTVGVDRPYLFVQSGTSITGIEGHGVLRFDGTLDSISWISPGPSEYWHGLTVGIDSALAAPVPEPGTWALLAAGLCLLVAAGRASTTRRTRPCAARI